MNWSNRRSRIEEIFDKEMGTKLTKYEIALMIEKENKTFSAWALQNVMRADLVIIWNLQREAK